MASIGTMRNSCWKRTSPIPADPIYEKYEDTARPRSHVQRRGPIPTDPIYSNRSGKYHHLTLKANRHLLYITQI